MDSLVLFIIEMAATVACAISGIRMAAGKRFDWFGAYIIGLVTAIGGGTLRDLLLDIPVFWMQTWWYIAVTVAAFAGVVLLRNVLVSRRGQARLLFIFDTIGLALFCVIGVEKSLAIGYPMWVAGIMGVITGAFGGVLRDILINVEPLVFRKDIYATACVAGTIVYWVLMRLHCPPVVQQTSCALTVIILRILAVKYHLSLPKLAPYPGDDSEG